MIVVDFVCLVFVFEWLGDVFVIYEYCCGCLCFGFDLFFVGILVGFFDVFFEFGGCSFVDFDLDFGYLDFEFVEFGFELLEEFVDFDVEEEDVLLFVVGYCFE